MTLQMLYSASSFYFCGKMSGVALNDFRFSFVIGERSVTSLN